MSRARLLSFLVSFSCVIACASPMSPGPTQVVASTSTGASAVAEDPCANEPWSWLPSGTGLTRLSVDAQAIRSSVFADAFHRHFATYMVAAVVDEPMERIAVAHRESPDGAVVVMRVAEPLDSSVTDLRPLGARVAMTSEGSLIGYEPVLRCSAPERGLLYMESDPALIPEVGRLPSLGLPTMKRITVIVRAEGTALVGLARLSFHAALPPGPILDAFILGIRMAAREKFGVDPVPEIVGSDILLRLVAGTGEEADRAIERIAQAFVEDENIAAELAASQPSATPPSVPPTRVPPTSGSNFGSISLAAGFLPDPVEAVGSSGGNVDASTWAPGCFGFVTTTPDHVLTATTSFSWLSFSARSAGDVTLIVERPDGSLICNDDFEATDPQVVLEHLSAGDYRVWVGSYVAGDHHRYTLGISELTSTRPSSLSP
jgi:hypothetical protein